MKIHHKHYEEIVTETSTEIEMTNRYYWCSRSVYAIEFKTDIYNSVNNPDADQVWYEMMFINVEFENNIIKSYKFNFSDKHPLQESKFNDSLRGSWVKELYHALMNEHYFDNRTKEQFDKDYNNVIENLSKLRD